VIPILDFYSLKLVGHEGIPTSSMESLAKMRFVRLIICGVDGSQLID